MTPHRALALLALALVAWPGQAAADWNLIPFIGSTFAGDTNLVDLDEATGETKLIYGGAASRLGEGILGLEVDFSYLPGFFEASDGGGLVTGSSVVTLMGNMVVTVPRRWTRYTLRPYGSAGVGVIRARIEDVSHVFPVDSKLFGADIGGGAVGFLTDRTGLRWDLRYFKSINRQAQTVEFAFGKPRLSFWRATMGVVFRY